MSRVRRRSSVAFTANFSFGVSNGTPNEFHTSVNNSEVVVDEIDPSQVAWGKLKRKYEKGLLGPVASRVYTNAIRTGDTGNEFQSQKILWDHPLIKTSAKKDVTPTVYRWLSGDPLPISPPATSFLTPSSRSVLQVAGGEAIRRVAPTNPHGSLAVAFGELFKDGLPSIPGIIFLRDRAKQGLLKSTSREYLNIEFGWKPLLSDINKLVESFSRADAIWQQFQKNANSKVRRRYAFPVDRTESITDLGTSYGYPAATTQLYSGPGRLYRSTTTSTEVWFSGAFRYAVPPESDAWSRARREAQRWHIVYGLDMSPETLWNLVPWTWLIDWVVNLGSVLKTLSLLSADGLVLQYGYVMEKKVEETVWFINNLSFADGGSCSPRLRLRRECRRRIKATPYGFSVNTDSFTERQWAILAAIGISRRP